VRKVLIANRGEIAVRIIRACRDAGLASVAVYGEQDLDALHAQMADEAFALGGQTAAESYLDIRKILKAAADSGADAVHPGYGFLAENPDFAASVQAAGLTWVGPSPESMAQMGDKINARNLMEAAGVPVAAGTREPVADTGAALAAAADIGYPVMVKASAGGGGIGMSAAAGPDQLTAGFETARTRAERFFGNPAILLERYVERARHVEVQILGLADGTVLALGERECSVQRRHQKVAEETPSPGVSPPLRARMLAAAGRAGAAVGYLGAGTVEFLVDVATHEFMFLEMNTRLQVEHPVTELVTGIDLVEQQFRIAAGEQVSFDPAGVTVTGHAIELRIYAEDPKRFLPSPGLIEEWTEPAGPGVRVDAGYVAGNRVTQNYDPLLAKLCVHGADRAAALDRAGTAVAAFGIRGLKTNLQFHADLLASAEFRSGEYDTSIVSRLRP
jgi:acetyl-CoA carboxylase, biotin carboxylase subunit